MDGKQRCYIKQSDERSNEKKNKADNLANVLSFYHPKEESVAEIFRQLSKNNIYPGQLIVEKVSSFLPKAKIERVSETSVLLTFPNGKTLFFTIQDNGSVVVLSKSDMMRRRVKNKHHLNDLLKHFAQQHEFCAKCAYFYDEAETKTVLTQEFKCSSMHSNKHLELCEICAELSNDSMFDQHNKHRCFYCQKMFFSHQLINRTDPDANSLLFLPHQLCVTLGYVASSEIPFYMCLKCSCDPRNI